MRVYPELTICFPDKREAELVGGMKARAVAPWHWQDFDTHGKPRENGQLFFHRDEVGDAPGCTVCIHRVGSGKFVVLGIVPDTYGNIPVDQYVGILREFDRLIAEPSASESEGITMLDTDKRTLEDYFPAEAIRLLKRFCPSNDYGSHPCDQERWMDFLLCVHRSKIDVHCDVFGECLKSAGIWPEDGIRELVQEFDFAMRLLHQADRTSPEVP